MTNAMPSIGENSLREKIPKVSVPQRLPARSQAYAVSRGNALNKDPIL
jgi:hypothetical protein